MPQNARLTTALRRAAVVAAAGAAIAALTGVGMGSASAEVGENLPQSCLEFSADGAEWSTNANATIDWTGDRPIPGNEVTNGTVKVRNVCDEPAKFQVYAGNWSITNNASAYLRANLDSNVGQRVDLVGEAGLLINETGRLAKNAVVDVKLFVGIPSNETTQGFTIEPAWSFALEEVQPGTDPGPGDPDPGDGGDDDCDGSSAGSLAGIDIFGSLGDSGSLCGASASVLTGGTDGGTIQSR